VSERCRICHFYLAAFFKWLQLGLICTRCACTLVF
jgi:hypothetical protein